MFLGFFLFCTMLPVQIATAEEETELTLMVYITGSDLESGSGAATGDITEMIRSGIDLNKVNILLMTGGSYKWWGGFPSDQLCIYQVEGRRPTLLEQSPAVSMGEADTLSYFLNYGYQNFPAKQYALILWDHGGGPMNGVCYDELFQQGGRPDSLSLMELKAALTASPFSADQPLEWIGFDACLMAAVETAHICAPFARYMIASQETEPGTGWSYSFLGNLNGSCTGADVGRMIIDSYFSDTRVNSAMTLSCIDLSKIGDVESSIDNLFGQLDQIIGPESFSQLSTSRREARSIGRASTGSDYDLVDLHHLAMQYEQHAPDVARQLQEAVQDAVVHQKSNIENTYGLSVYYPYYNKAYFSALWMDVYFELDFADNYLKYMTDYADLWLGESLADWNGLRTVALPVLEENVQTLTLPLTEAQQAHFASAELYVLDEFPTGGGYYDIYHTDDVQFENGELTAEYDYRALYALDADGNPVSDALTYIIQDDTYLVRATLAEVPFDLFDAEWTESHKLPVYLQCVLNEQTDELEMTGMLKLPDEVGAFAFPESGSLLLSGKQTVTMDDDDWPIVYFMRRPQVLTRDENDSIVPYPDWPSPSEAVDGYVLLETYEIDNTMPWTLKFCERQYGGRSLLAQYVVTDTQGNRFASDLLPIDNLNLAFSSDLNITLADNDDYTIRLSRVDVANSERDIGLYVYGTFENHSDDPFKLRAENFFFEQTALGITDSSSAAAFTGDDISDIQAFHFFIPESDFPPMVDTTLESFCFDLQVFNSEFDIVQTIPVAYDQSIDLSKIITPTIPAKPLAVSSVDGGICELLGLSETEEGLVARLHLVNNGDDDLELDWNVCDAGINRCIFTGGFVGADILLPVDCDQYVDVSFRRTTPAPMLFDCALPAVDGFDYWNIHQVEILSIGDDCTFALPEPFAVNNTFTGEQRQTLLDSDDLNVELHGVSQADNLLTAEFVMSNHSNCEIELTVKNILLNGIGAEASCCNEVYPVFGNTWTIPAGSSLRGGLQIDLVNESPEHLEFSFCYSMEAQNFTTSAAVIDCRASSVEAPAEMLRNDLIDPMIWIDTEVILPENAADYAVTLTAQLTQEQAESFERASVVLAQYVPDEGVYRLCYLKNDCSMDPAGLLGVDYNGLLVCAKGQSHPIITVQQVADGSVSLYGTYLSSSSYEEENLYFDSINLCIAEDLSSAVIESADVSRLVYEQETFHFLNVTHDARIPFRLENGLYANALEWTSDSMLTGWYYKIPDMRAGFSMLPAETVESLHAIFCIYNTDGTSYSLEPIPYEKACAAK